MFVDVLYGSSMTVESSEKERSGFAGWIAGNWFLFGMAVAMALAFTFPRASEEVGRLKSLVVASLIFFMGLTTDTHDFFRVFRRPGSLFLGIFLCYVISPLVVFPTGTLLFGAEEDRQLLIGVALVACATTTVATSVVYTRVAGGNQALALTTSCLANVLSVVVTPLLLKLTLKTTVAVQASGMIKKMMLLVLLPIIISQVTRKLMGKTAYKIAPASSRAAQVGILILIFITTGGAQKVLTPAVVGKLAVLAAVCHTAVFLIGLGLGKAFGLARENTIGTAFAGSQKTLTTTTWLAKEYFTPGATIPIVVYHYVQLLIGHVFVRMLKKKGTSLVSGQN